MPGLASAKVIVIAGQSSAGTGSWLSVPELAVIRSILPVVSYSVAFDASPARVAEDATPPIGPASITDRLAPQSIRNCSESTTIPPAPSPHSITRTPPPSPPNTTPHGANPH